MGWEWKTELNRAPVGKMQLLLEYQVEGRKEYSAVQSLMTLICLPTEGYVMLQAERAALQPQSEGGWPEQVTARVAVVFTSHTGSWRREDPQPFTLSLLILILTLHKVYHIMDDLIVVRTWESPFQGSLPTPYSALAT